MKNFIGTVLSTKMSKTLTVKVISQVRHPLYKKIIHKSKKIKVDYENIKVSEGDRVLIVETRPISKTKHFKLVKVL